MEEVKRGERVIDKMKYRKSLQGADRELGMSGDNWYPSREEAERFCRQYELEVPPEDCERPMICFHDTWRMDGAKSPSANPQYYAVASNADRRWKRWNGDEDGADYVLVVRVSENGEV
jgi:hypothetical protein